MFCVSCELRVICVQETWYWPGEVTADAVVMSGVRCSGTEMSLSHCLHHGAHLSCPKGGGRNAAGVSCSESKTAGFISVRWPEVTLSHISKKSLNEQVEKRFKF